MVKTFQDYLSSDCHRTYSCVHCRAHLARHSALISKVMWFDAKAQRRPVELFLENLQKFRVLK